MMIKSGQSFINKVHLIISVFVVIPAAFIYAFKPELIINVNLTTIDEHNMFKAIMGVYLAFSFLWVLGIINSRFLKTALISNVLFMLGLGVGRLLSMMIDGTPSIVYVLGACGELFLAFYGIWVLNFRSVNLENL